MLLCIQFPFADARRFLDKIERLETPTWPQPTPDSEFIRYFGAIRNRPRGGLDSWIAEDPICEAIRALSFSKAPVFMDGQSGSRIVFRRLYFDGWAVGKLEIGISIRISKLPAELLDLEDSLLRLPVYIRNHATGAAMKSELAQAGKHIAQLYLAATTSTKRAIAEEEKWQVRAGTPILYLEATSAESLEIPKPAQPIKLPDRLAHLKVAYHGIPYRGGKIPMWIIQNGQSVEEANLARTLRLYLLRLNAESESLRLILQSLANQDIKVTPGTTASKDLQWYLGKALARIARVEAKTAEVNVEIAEAARQSMNVIRPGQLGKLLETVEDYRRYVRQDLEKFAIKDAKTVNYIYTEELTMTTIGGNQYNIDNKGILNLESTLSNVSQNVNNVSSLDQPGKDDLKQLIEQLNVALQKTPAGNLDEATAIAKTTERLVEDIKEEKPNKPQVQITLDGLKKAAENIAKVVPDVLPIVAQIVKFAARVAGLG